MPTDTAYLTPRRLVSATDRLRRMLGARRSFDLIWLQWSTLSDLGFLLAAKAAGLPVLVTPHLGGNARLQRVRILREVCRAALKSADRIGVLFSGQPDEVALPDHVPISTLRTFLPRDSLARPASAKSPGGLRLIHAGRLSEGKGTFRTVDLCAGLRKRGVPFQARIIGRADEETNKRLHSMVEEAALANRIEVVEWLSETALGGALAEADVLAHLSVLDSFPLIVLEAMAAGTVPIVGEMAGARSMVAAYGGHVAPDSDPMNAAEWLAAQPIEALRRQGAKMAEQVRRDYSWEACATLAVAAADATLANRASL